MAFNFLTTFLAGHKITAAEWNTYIKDNFAELFKYTAKGDLVYGNSASTTAKLGIGTAGQVLTVSGDVPVWASPAVIGCKVFNTGSQAITTGVETEISTLNSESFDAGSFHEGSNGYLTVPAGLAGYYLITANGYFTSHTTNGQLREIGIKINTSVFNRQSSANAGDVDPTHISVNCISYLSAGDIVKIVVTQKAGITLNFNYFILSLVRLGA